jgi:hypothetical protein
MIMKPQAKKSLKKMPLPKGAKSGVGRLVLKDFAEKYSLDLKRIMNVLKINKLKAQPHMTIKEVAQKNNVSPPDEIIKEGLKKK